MTDHHRLLADYRAGRIGLPYDTWRALARDVQPAPEERAAYDARQAEPDSVIQPKKKGKKVA